MGMNGQFFDRNLMQIDSLRLLHLAEPLAVPESFGDFPLDRQESVLVELRSGAHSAWGQADPGTDYVPASGTVTFAPGETSKTVPVTVKGDTTAETDEYIVVSFTHPTNARMGGFWGLGFGVITNDDAG